MRKIAIIGSTGSVGSAAINVVKLNKDVFEVDFLVVNSSYEKVIEQAYDLKVAKVVIVEPINVKEIQEYIKTLPSNFKLEIFYGLESVVNLIKEAKYDVLLIASCGTQSIYYYNAALESGKIIAMANKEAIVCSGFLCQNKKGKHSTTIIPVDSEHSALFQIINKYPEDIQKIVLTASGGPFIDLPLSKLTQVTKEQALQHPTWSMGPKITIDSASFMNKALEFIEAFYLFNLKVEQIEVAIHRQSIMHGGVHFVDGTFIGHYSNTSMELPVAYALGYPNRISTNINFLSLQQLSNLTFETVDETRFQPINWAKEVLRLQGNMPCVLNTVNEVAVKAFLENKISFIKILYMIEYFLNKIERKDIATIEELILEYNSIKKIAEAYIKENIS